MSQEHNLFSKHKNERLKQMSPKNKKGKIGGKVLNMTEFCTKISSVG